MSIVIVHSFCSPTPSGEVVHRRASPEFAVVISKYYELPGVNIKRVFVCYFVDTGLCKVLSSILMTYTPRLSTMPTQVRCDRVPPADGIWGALDLRLLQEDDLPLDPRTWGRSEVGSWVARRGGLPERFPMNGKALCLMSRDMFASRVPSAGHQLYQDFRRRLAKALALQELMEKMSTK